MSTQVLLSNTESSFSDSSKTSLRLRAASGGVLVGAGQAVAYGASLIRNMILARILSKSDFGIAAAFSLMISLVEFSSKLGISRFVVQDEDGDNPDFIATAQAVQSLAGLLGAGLIIVGSPWLGQLFNISDHCWAIRLLAIAIVCRSLEHLDIHRYERSLRFWPATVVEAVPQVIVMVMTWPVAWLLKDFRAVLVLLLTKLALACLLTHCLAERPYSWHWCAAFAARLMRFGWPLLVTGFLMLGIMQGDQFLVASFYSMSELAPYAAAASLTVVPTFLISSVFASVFLPILARAQKDRARFQHLYKRITALVGTATAVVTVGFLVGAEAIMRITYGAKYIGSGPIMAWLATAVAFRNLRILPATAALARGDSKNQMYSNLGRAVALLPATFFAFNHYPVWTLAASGLFGELMAWWISVVRLRQRDAVPLVVTAWPTLLLVAVVTLSGVFGSCVVYKLPAGFAVAVAITASLGVTGGALLAFPTLRKDVTDITTAWFFNAYSRIGKMFKCGRAGPATYTLEG